MSALCQIAPRGTERKFFNDFSRAPALARTQGSAYLDQRNCFIRMLPHMESLVFAPPKVAEYNSAIHRALEATTWGEFKARIPPKEYKQHSAIELAMVLSVRI